ncbi:MAG: hypothetical protein GX621_10510, partial [Pirellulaceae bacterium]|nr:hypothetical protein [Pirellulaceae bacterium]
MSQLTLYPIADNYLLVAVVSLLLFGLLALGPRGGAMSRRRRLVIAGLRLGAVLMLILAMLRPTIVRTETRKQSATLAVLADVSRSMSVPDTLGGRSTRYEAMRLALDGARDEFKKIARDFEIKVHAFDARTAPLDVTDGRIALPES